MPLNDEDRHFHELTEYVRWHYESQKEDRARHQELGSYFLNEYYPTGGNKGYAGTRPMETSFPLISMTARAWSRHTIAKSPRVSVTAHDPGLRSWSESAEAASNERIEESRLGMEIGEFARQSFCSIGVMHVGAVFDDVPGFGTRLDLETRTIDRGDWLCDFTGVFPETCDIQGHRFRAPLAVVRNHPMFLRSAAEQVYASGERTPTESTRYHVEHRFNDLYQYVELACVYERRTNRLIYYPWEQPHLKLAEYEHFGPAEGPYLYLYYEKPVNTAKPIAPLSHLVKKHRATNILDVKAMVQSLTSKGCLFYTNATKDAAKRTVDARDNQSVLAESGAARWMHIGGPSPDLVAMQEKQKRDFSWSAGNLESYAGLNPSAPTLGQERLLRGASNEMLEDMGECATLAMADLCRRIVWFDVRDPDPRPREITKTNGRTRYKALWTKEHRDFVRMNRFKATVEPYSFRLRTPEGRLADVLGAVQLFQSLREEGAAQGIMLDVEAIVRTVAKAKNLPELYEVLILNQDPAKLAQLLGGGQQQRPDPNKPGGRYIRESVSDGAGADMEMMRMFGRQQEAAA